WVRYAQGSRAEDTIVKLDIDLCDELGNACVQMHGFSTRALSQEISATGPQSKATGTLLAIPLWEASSVEASAEARGEYSEHHVILCELPKVEVGKLGSMLWPSQCQLLEAGGEKNIGQRYSEYALACFERMKSILQSKPQGKVLVQVVAGGDGEQVLLAGLSGLLKTAAQENPQIVGQLILVPQDMTTEELGRCLEEEKSGGLDRLVKDTLIRYEQGTRQVVRWQEIGADEEKPAVAFRDQGVYLITGGLGGLGVVFAQEILERTCEARVVLTGRSALSGEKQARLEGLRGQAGRVSYRQVDLCDLHQVQRLIAGIQQEYGKL